MKRLVLVLAVTIGTGLASAGCEDDPTDLDFTKPKASQDGGVHHDGGSSSADSGSAGSGGADSGSAGAGGAGSSDAGN